MNVTIFTSIADMVKEFFGHSILERSLEENIWSLKIVNIKDYGRGLHKRIDDYSCGGGGMLMRPDVLGNCINDNIDQELLGKPSTMFVYMSPRGEIFHQAMAEQMVKSVSDLYVLCGRFEGVDQRIIDYYNMKEISIGNFVLLGGEVASFAIIESIVRLLPNVINGSTLLEESFSTELDGMLEYDQFTSPRTWNEIPVPDELTSGNHAEIRRWRLNSAKQRTRDRQIGTPV